MMAPAEAVVPTEPDIYRQKRKRSYFLRHWRGELSLPVSYWLNGWVTYLFVAFMWVIATLIQPITGTTVWACVVSLAWVFGYGISVWQGVGIIRSANNHGKGFWAGAASVFTFLGFVGLIASLGNSIPQLIEVWKIAAGDTAFANHTLKILRDGTELEYSGYITFGATDEVRKFLDADAAIKAIHLNSNGGRIAEALKLAELIKQRKLITYTSSVCASACTIPFLAGVRRYVGTGARLGFHRPSFPGLSSADLEIVINDERQRLIASNVPTWFIDHALTTPTESMWWPTPDELMQAKIITDVAGSNNFALSGVQEDISYDTVDIALTQNTTLVAIKRFEPATYAKLVSTVVDGLKLGKTQDEMRSIMLSIISDTTKKNFPIASDSALLDMTKVMIEEIDAIMSKDTEACYRFLKGGSASPNLGDYASVELINRDSAAAAAIIESAATTPQAVPTELPTTNFEILSRNLAAKFSSTELAILTDMNSPNVDHTKVCAIFVGMLREIMNLPNDRVVVLRYMFKNGL